MDSIPAISHKDFLSFSNEIATPQAEPPEWIEGFLVAIGEVLNLILGFLPWDWSSILGTGIKGMTNIVFVTLLVLVIVAIPSIIFLLSQRPGWERKKQGKWNLEKEENLEFKMTHAFELFQKGETYRALLTTYQCMIAYLDLRHGIYPGLWWSHKQLKRLVAEKSPDSSFWVAGILNLCNQVVFAHGHCDQQLFHQYHAQLNQKIKEAGF